MAAARLASSSRCFLALPEVLDAAHLDEPVERPERERADDEQDDRHAGSPVVAENTYQTLVTAGLRQVQRNCLPISTNRLLIRPGFTRGNSIMARRPPVTKLLGKPSALPASPDEAVLDRVPNPQTDTNYVARFAFPEFTSICPVTGQPDFGIMMIDYVPRRWLIESKSLKLYLN